MPSKHDHQEIGADPANLTDPAPRCHRAFVCTRFELTSYVNGPVKGLCISRRNRLIAATCVRNCGGSTGLTR